MKVYSAQNWYCECACPMEFLTDIGKFPRLMRCCNPDCKQHEKPVKEPSFEVRPVAK